MEKITRIAMRFFILQWILYLLAYISAVVSEEDVIRIEYLACNASHACGAATAMVFEF